MKEARWWRWASLALVAVAAAVFASFNAGERVALNLGFTFLYQVPLVSLIFIAFLAGMVTMFLLGLRHDLRVRRALREAGFGEPVGSEPEPPPVWEEPEAVEPPARPVERPHVDDAYLPRQAPSADDPHPARGPDWEPPLR